MYALKDIKAYEACVAEAAAEPIERPGMTSKSTSMRECPLLSRLGTSLRMVASPEAVGHRPVVRRQLRHPPRQLRMEQTDVIALDGEVRSAEGLVPRPPIAPLAL